MSGYLQAELTYAIDHAVIISGVGRYYTCHSRRLPIEVVTTMSATQVALALA